MKTALVITVILLIYTMIQHGKEIKKNKHLQKRINDLQIPFDDYSMYQDSSVKFYRYLADLRKTEPNGNVQIINEILDKYDDLIFNKE